MAKEIKLTEAQVSYAVTHWGKAIHTALDCGYIRNIGREEFENLTRFYNEVFGAHRVANGSCATCVMEMIKSIGVLVRDYKPERVEVKGDEPKPKAVKTKSRARTAKVEEDE